MAPKEASSNHGERRPERPPTSPDPGKNVEIIEMERSRIPWRTHRRQSRLRATARSLASLAWLVTMYLPAVAFSQQASGVHEVSAATTAPMVSQTDSDLWLYLAAIGVSLILCGVYLVRRARAHQHMKLLSMEIDALEPRPLMEAPARQEPQAAAESELQTLARSLAQNSASELGALAIESEMGSPLFALRTEGPQRECPKCHRKFASWMAICPFDTTPLRDPAQQLNQARKHAIKRARASNAQEGALKRKRCLTCERRFRDDLTYCPFDAEKLVHDHREDAQEAEAWYVCKSCGEDKLVSQGELTCGCDEDARDHITLDPAKHEPPGMSLNACPVCHTYAAPGQTHCPEHDELFMPEDFIARHALPASGYGPARKICVVCCARYAASYNYCTHDKARLKHID